MACFCGCEEFVKNSDGKIIADDQDTPGKFDIITSAVIYRSWSDPEKRESDIIKKAERHGE